MDVTGITRENSGEQSRRVLLKFQLHLFPTNCDLGPIT